MSDDDRDRELQFLRKRLQDLGGKLFHVNEEITRLNAENNRIRTATEVMSEVYETLDVADTLEHASRVFLAIVVKQLNLDAAALFHLADGCYQPIVGIGCTPLSQDHPLEDILPSFWVRDGHGSQTVQNEVQADAPPTVQGSDRLAPDISRLVGSLMGIDLEDSGLAYDPKLKLALIVGRLHRGGKIREPLSASDEIVLRSALGVYADVHTKYSYTAQLNQLNTDLDIQARSFERFVPKDFLKHLKRERIREIELGDSVECDMAVLFTDIRSFTQVSETLTATEVFELLNGYLGTVVPHIRNHGGFVDKYIGDAVMALFHDPSAAVKAGVAMLRALDDFNDRMGTSIEIGVGVHWGSVVMGTLGDASSMQCTVISDHVNLASRIEGLTKYFGVRMIVSEDALTSAVGTALATRSLGRIVVKGRSKPVQLHHVISAEMPKYAADFMAQRDSFIAAIESLEKGDIPATHAQFQQLFNVNPKDVVLQRYLEEIAHATASNIAWDGLIRMRDK